MASASNLQLRVGTAILGLPLLVAIVWFGGWAFAAAAAAIAALAIAEFVHGFLFPTLPLRAALQGAQIAIGGAVGVLMAQQLDWAVVVIALLGGALLLLGLLPTNVLGPRKPYRVQGGALLYVGVPLAALVMLRAADDGRAWVFLVLLATFAVDTGAYATGRAIGRHRMAPSISPGKTWEGAIGGALAGVVATVLLGELFDLGLEPWQYALLAPAIPPVAILGDLFESWLKRRMGVKDSSSLLPGHGGFLDRLDSVIPVGLVVSILGLAVF